MQGASQPDGCGDASRVDILLPRHALGYPRVLTMLSGYAARTTQFVCRAAAARACPTCPRVIGVHHGGTVTQIVTHGGPDMSVTALIYDEAIGWLVSLIPCSQNRIRDLGGSALIAQCPKR